MSAGAAGSSIAGLGAAELMAAMGAAAQNGGLNPAELMAALGGVGGQNALGQLAASLGRQALEQNFGLEERVNRELVNEEVRLRDVVHAAQLAELQAHRVAEATLIAARDDEQAALVALLKPELASYAAKARAAELSLQKHRAVMSEIESRGLGTRSAAAADPGASAAAAAAAAAERGHAATLKEQLAAFEAMGGDRETVIHHGGSAAQFQSAALSAAAANDHVAATVRARLAAAAWTPGGASLHGLGGAGNLSGRVQGANDAMKQAAAHAAAAHHAATAAAAKAAAPGGLHDIPVSDYVDAQARKKEQDAMKRRANDKAREERLKSELAAEEAARLKRKADTAARRNAKYNADGNVVADDYDGWSAAKMRKRFKPDACDDADAASAAASSWDGKNDWRITAEEVLTRLLNADEDEIFHKPVDIVALNIPTYPDVIATPMDLGTIRKKLKAGARTKNKLGRYENAREMKADLDLVFDNCVAFNGAESYIGKLAAGLKSRAEVMWAASVGKMTATTTASASGEEENGGGGGAGTGAETAEPAAPQAETADPAAPQAEEAPAAAEEVNTAEAAAEAEAPAAAEEEAPAAAEEAAAPAADSKRDDEEDAAAPSGGGRSRSRKPAKVRKT
jgi:hypothetical protein